MSKIAIINTDPQLMEVTVKYCQQLDTSFRVIQLEQADKSLEYLKYELPEICVINFADKKIDSTYLIKKIKQDTWLHYGGIIGVYDFDQRNTIFETVKNTNIISLMLKPHYNMHFPRVLRIITQNRQILFQRYIHSQLITNISNSFIINNDPFDINVYSNLLANYLFNLNYINQEIKEKLQLILVELFMNAVEHGNCKISYQEKSEWLNQGKQILDLIKEKNKDPQIRAKKIVYHYKINPLRTMISIKDQGDGFDWQKRIELTGKDNLELHGRGIKMAKIYFPSISYNKKGNEVTLKIEHQKDEINVVPQAFNEQEEIKFNDNEIVFQEGEESDFLYYIVSGKFNIYANNKVISSLSTKDIFLGEMSFLLGNQRSATVRSTGKSVLLKISKKDFLTSIKNNPHYGIFLSRLLAQRIDKINRLSGKK